MSRSAKEDETMRMLVIGYYTKLNGERVLCCTHSNEEGLERFEKIARVWSEGFGSFRADVDWYFKLRDEDKRDNSVVRDLP